MRTKIATLMISAFLLVSMISVFRAGTVSAQEPEVELKATGNGAAEWTDETAGVGAYSVKLFWPVSCRAFVKILNIPSELKISDVGSWSYWANAPKYYMPQLTFYVDHSGIDNPDGKDYDTTISASFGSLGNETWIKVDEKTITESCGTGAYVLWINSDDKPVYGNTWADIREGFKLWGEEHDYGDSIVKHLKIGKGVIGTNREITAYVDDAVIGGVTYILETSPLQAEIEGLNAEIDELERQLRGKDATIASLNAQIGDLESRIAELETTDIVYLKKQIDTLEGEISSLKSQISRLEASGISDASTISTLRRECSELEKDVKYWKNRPRSTRVITTGGIGEDGGQVVFAVALGAVGIAAMLCVKSFTTKPKSKKG